MKNVFTSLLLVSYLVGYCQMPESAIDLRRAFSASVDQPGIQEFNTGTAFKDSKSENAAYMPTEEHSLRHGIGLGGGWGAPYGFGLEYSNLLTSNFDLNLGAGFSFSGLRTGFGSRYFFIKDKSSPFIGVNYIYTTGLSGLEVNVNGVAGEYKIYDDQAVFFRGGYSFDVGDVLIMINAGYGFPFDERDAEFQRGDYSSSQQDFANLQALGGIEISGTVIIRIGKKK